MYAACAALAGCASFKGPESTLTSEGPSQKVVEKKSEELSEADKTLIRKFVETYGKSYDAGSGGSDDGFHQEFLAAGLQLVKSNCDDFFRALGEERQDMDFAESIIGIGGTAATAATGTFGGSAKTLTLMAAGIAAALGITEGYSNVYLFGPDTDAVKQLVDSAQAAYLSKLREIQVHSFYEAHGYIQGYQGICEVQSVKKLVNEAVLKGTVRAKTSAGEALVAEADAAAISAIERIVETSPLSQRQLAALYWLFVIRPDEPAQAVIKEELKTLRHGPVIADSSGNLSFRTDPDYDDEKRKLHAWLRALSAQEKSRLLATIKQIEVEKGLPAPLTAVPGAETEVPAEPAPTSVPSIIILEVE